MNELSLLCEWEWECFLNSASNCASGRQWAQYVSRTHKMVITTTESERIAAKYAFHFLRSSTTVREQQNRLRLLCLTPKASNTQWDDKVRQNMPMQLTKKKTDMSVLWAYRETGAPGEESTFKVLAHGQLCTLHVTLGEAILKQNKCLSRRKKSLKKACW